MEYTYLDISEVADDQFILVDTGAPVKNIFLVLWDESHPVFLQREVCVPCTRGREKNGIYTLNNIMGTCMYVCHFIMHRKADSILEERW